VERGVEDDPDVHAAVVVVNECVDRGGIAEFVDGDTDRTDRNADQTDDGGVTGAGLLDQLIVGIGRVCAAPREWLWQRSRSSPQPPSLGDPRSAERGSDR